MSSYRLIKNYCHVLLFAQGLMVATLTNAYGNSGISKDLNTFFDNLGYDKNVTQPSSYQSQAAGYYSGGSIVLRNRVNNIQLMQLDLPDVRAGCGGIDLHTGGFSFVSGEALKKFFNKNNNCASGYMFSLALETVVPEIAKTMHDIQKIAQDINASNLNSCEMTENMIGGMMPKMAALQRHVCAGAGNGKPNVFSDWAQARQKCRSLEGNDQGMNHASSDANYKDQVILNKNLIWHSLDKITFLSSKDLREFFMSLSGTIVFDASGKAKIYPPLAKDQNMLKALLEGGKANIYQCDTADYCINPKIAELEISKTNALYYRINDSINQIATALITDQEKLSPKLQGFLALTKLPILKFITAHLMSGNAAMALSITNYSESIAKSLLMQYLHEALQVAEKSLSGTDYAPDVHKQLIEQIRQALIYVENIKVQSHHDIQELMTFVTNAKQTEQETMTKVTGQLKSSMSNP